MKNLLLVHSFIYMLFSVLFSKADTGLKGVSPSRIGDVSVFVTTDNREYDFEKLYINFSEVSGESLPVIDLDPSTRFQSMHGFGAALTGSSCYNLMQMNPQDRRKFLEETFSHEKGAGFSYTRISIGCSDFSLSEYTLCDTPGIENFSLQEEELKYVIPILKEILEINPDLKIMGSPWTCPRWMKVNNLTERAPHDSWTGGHLNPALYDDYAIYFKKWIEAFASQGIHITSVSPQNEPLHRGNSASLFMGWEEQREFVKILGPKLREAGLDTRIYVFDHNYNYDNLTDQFNYPVRIYEDLEARKYVAGAAYHNYGGSRKELLNIHAQAPYKELIFTEASIGTWNNGRDLSKRLLADMRELALGTVNNRSRAVIVWNLMLDTNRGPNREKGCRTCFGAVDIDASDYKTISRNSHYYMLCHMASVVKPNAVRIGAELSDNELFTYSAFENSDGTLALVVLNEAADGKSLVVRDGINQFTANVPARSVVSFRWKSGLPYYSVRARKNADAPEWTAYSSKTVGRLPGFVMNREIPENSFGSLKENPSEATGFFRVEKRADRWWIIDPEGYPFIHKGVAVFRPGNSDRQEAALRSRFGNRSSWADEEIMMLRNHGFNGTGAWSDADLIRNSASPLVYTVIINPMGSYKSDHLKKFGGKYEMAGWQGYRYDLAMVFDPEFDEYVEKAVAPIAKYAGDKYLLGYFTDNELPWKNDALDRHLKYLGKEEAGYIAAKKWLDERKNMDATLEEITDEDRLAFTGYYFETYMRKVTAAIQKYDPNHMYLGCRFNQEREELNNPEIFRVAGKYMDIVSINHYRKWEPVQQLMANWADWSGRPFMITEWYTKGEDSGLPNKTGAGWNVPTQTDRGYFYQNFVIELLNSKACVGWHWFTYQDNDPLNLRTDPSNRDSNKGIVDSDYNPYQPLLDQMKMINRRVYPLIEYLDQQ